MDTRVQMKFYILLILAFIHVDCAVADSLNERRDNIAKESGVERELIDSIEENFEAKLKFYCIGNSCQEIESHCKQYPYVNICTMKALYHSAMLNELCAGSESCFAEQTLNERKIVTFVSKQAMSPGYGRMALNICSPLNEFESEESNIKSIGDQLNQLAGIGTFYDYTGLYNCVSETYKGLAVKALAE
ncbi:hypothetical protein EW121_18995 [Vibrio cholerae]|nr:hypothetical protein [Vibrio cholerae]EGR0779185.1 hypothetical protein [Vibrio cholerae]EGR0783035.1 hypothetical protein [Vibrio cholerae]EGR0824722.1 hypothetical protein [Vibrio cholerae]EGR0833109.1 hypothetical protein [Vibrio cholerae]